MKVKICGITRLEDAQLCADLGVDFLGFIFVKTSPRYVMPEKAAEIVLECGSASYRFPKPRSGSAAVESGSWHYRTPNVVGVFRDQDLREIRRIAELVGLDTIQLHGSESDDDIRAIGMPVIKALRVEHALPDTNTSAEWLMFDSGGGTGRTFDWSLLANYPRTKPFFLAGGLNPDNVAEAIRTVNPDAIDLSSGVESAPGVKDHHKVRQLMERVK